jgi:hypothetical protein
VPPARLLACVRRAIAAANGPAADAALDRIDALEGEAVLRSMIAPDPAYVEAVRLVSAARAQGRSLSASQRHDLMWALLLNDRFDEAAALAPGSNWNAGEPFPRRGGRTPRTEGQAVSWRWDVQHNELQPDAIDLRHGAQVVVLASPGCHFCAQLATAIAKDEGLTRAFGSSIWIQRPDAAFTRADAARWERLYPGRPIRVVFDVTGWPMPEDGYLTPQIFFLRDGAVVRRVKGWDPARADELAGDFRAIGRALDAPVAH